MHSTSMELYRKECYSDRGRLAIAKSQEKECFKVKEVHFRVKTFYIVALTLTTQP